MLQSVNFRLADAVPAHVIEGWRDELQIRGDELPRESRDAELRRRIEKYADQGRGACWLARPEVAEIVEASLLHSDGARYRLIAWCVMPNHVHVLAETMQGDPLSDVVKAWKSYTAHACNRSLSRRGRFWMPDYFDRFIRNEEHLHAAIAYIENNPVEARLCHSAEHWRWSSGWRRGARRDLSPGREM